MNIRRIGSKHCIGGAFALSCGDGCPSYAERRPDAPNRSFIIQGNSGFLGQTGGK
jgi:hypothetical protein